jgi:hypothetical protein
MPPYDSLVTLTELTTLVRQTGAREVWCLGDSFHDAEGATACCPRRRDAVGADGARRGGCGSPAIMIPSCAIAAAAR